MIVTDSIVSGNTANNGGGGIFSPHGTLTLNNSTVRANSESVGVGGGITSWLDGTVTLNNSTVTENSSGVGGGIYFYGSGSLTITNSTISGNAAIFPPGSSSCGYGAAGGLFVYGTVTITNTTITGNTAVASDGGIFGEQVSLRNTIIAGNSAGTGNPDCGGTLISQGYNLVQDTSGCTITGDLTGNITGQDPLLGPLQNNGGPTFTHALLSGSPAIDTGDDSVVGSPLFLTTDQRGAGFRRLYGAHVDIGADEVQPPPSDPPQTSPINVTKTGDTNDGFCGIADCSLKGGHSLR